MTCLDLTARLPVEILAGIFSLLKDSTRGDEVYGFRAPWVRVTWVCTRWRRIALDMSSLWTSVSLTAHAASLDAATILWERAGHSLLDMAIQASFDSDVAQIFKAVQLSGKLLGSLRLYYDGDVQFHVVQVAARSLNMDRLSSLELTHRGWDRRDGWMIDLAMFPSLRSLRVDRVRPIANSACLNLRTLGLKNIFTHDEDGIGGELHAIHAFLQCCPFLEELTLNDAFPDTTSAMYKTKDIPNVTLPRLRRLRVHEPVIDIAKLLEPLRLPALTYLAIRPWTCGGHDFSVFWDIFPTNSHQVIPLLSQTNTLALCVGSTNPDKKDFILRGTRLADPECLDGRTDPQTWKVSLRSLLSDDYMDGSEDIGEESETLIDEMPHLLNCANMLCLELHVAHGLLDVERDWHAWLQQFPRVRTLALGSGELVNNALVALQKDVAGLLLPELEKLSLCMGNPKNKPAYPYLSPILFEWLKRRGREGRLRSVTMRVPKRGTPKMLEELGIARILLCVLRLATSIGDAQVVTKHCSHCHAVYSGTVEQ